MNKNEFAPRPPMGWNSYDYYDTAVRESQVRKNAEYMAKHLKSYGWEYIVVDIQWYAHKAGSQRAEHQYIPFSELEMDEYSRLLPDPERFPSSRDGAGFRPLADYIHSLGLKFGIHIMRGIPRAAAHAHGKIEGCALRADQIADPSSICGWNPDMYGVRRLPEGQRYYDSLIELYASWGVDFIKCDDICNTNLYPTRPYSAGHEVEMLSRAIRRCGRPMVLSLSPGPALIDKAWDYEKYANMWRITDDFWDSWELLKNMFERCELWQNHVRPGCYPDCDMLPLGVIGGGFCEERMTRFTRDEQRTMMTLWCIFGSPLMLGAEMTRMDEWTLSLLTNLELLALNQSQHQARQIRRSGECAVWYAKRENTEEHYVALFNLSDEKREVSVKFEELYLELSRVEWKELWEQTGGNSKGRVIAKELPAHGCAVYQFHAVRS